MRLVVVHYHLLPGGVTDVIRDSVAALFTHWGDISDVVLLTGREQNADAVATAIRDAGGATAAVRHECWPELDYASQQESAEQARGRAAVITERLSTVCGENAVLWVHNYHVGKNAGLTAAVSALADRWSEPTDPTVLLHIHDFPEDGRFANLSYIRRTLGAVPYPTGIRTRYAVINTRDQAVLARAGIPKHQLFHLPNPVRVIGQDQHGDRSRLRDRLLMGLSTFAAERGHRFHPDGPVILYPVRAIRRKNILELATISRMMDGWNLVVTLPGTSEQERPYSELVEWAYTDRRIHGCFGIGRAAHRYGFRFDELFAGVDLVASSSVQEGFGLAYLNTLLARVPLLARKLETMGGLLPMFNGYPAHLYDRFLVPLTSPSLSSLRGYLRLRYAERIDEIAESVPEKRDQLEREFETLIASEAIDFSFLPAQVQLTVLGDIRDDSFAKDVRALNENLITAVTRLIGEQTPDVGQRVAESFGPGAFAARFGEVLAGTRDNSAAEAAGDRPGGEIADEVLNAFCGVEQARLLLGPLDHD